MMKDKFGNYVVQTALRKSPGSPLQYTIVGSLLPRLADLACQKFASNVVELGFTLGDEGLREKMLDHILADMGTLRTLAGDNYGNYVVQSMLSHAPESQRDRTIEALRTLKAELEETAIGRMLLAKLRKSGGVGGKAAPAGSSESPDGTS